MARRMYYNPMLDPACRAKMTEEMRKAVEDGVYVEHGGPLNEPDDAHPANLVSSLDDWGRHLPALDIDVSCRVVASSTPGHCHIYFDETPLNWSQYLGLLGALVAAGIMEERYLAASVRRGQTLLRPPGQTKEVDSF